MQGPERPSTAGQSPPSVGLVVNVSEGDVALLPHTLPHILRAQHFPLAEVTVVRDPRPPSGRIARLVPEGQFNDLARVLDQLHERLTFNEVAVDYDPDSTKPISKKYFNRRRVAARCAGGTPILPFLAGLDAMSTDFVVHSDCDMLFYTPAERPWISEAIRTLSYCDDIQFVNPFLGLPNFDGRPHDIVSSPGPDGRRRSQRFSTRVFCYDRRRLEVEFLPLRLAKHPLWKRIPYRMQGRSVLRALEQCIEATLYDHGQFRCDLDPIYGSVIHAANKRAFLDPSIVKTIAEIEEGNISERQRGNANLV